MMSRASFAGWYRNRYVWVAVILVTVSVTAAMLVNSSRPEQDLQGQIMDRMRTTLEQTNPD